MKPGDFPPRSLQYRAAARSLIAARPGQMRTGSTVQFVSSAGQDPETVWRAGSPKLVNWSFIGVSVHRTIPSVQLPMSVPISVYQAITDGSAVVRPEPNHAVFVSLFDIR